jgi:acyl carrier protein
MLLEEFHDLVVTQLLSQLPEKAVAIRALRSDDDLLNSGLIDSYAFVDLCLAVEAKTGAIIDIGLLEPEQIGSIAALYDVAISRGAVATDASHDREGLVA